MNQRPLFCISFVFIVLFVFTACSSESTPPVDSGKQKVVATTTIAADVVRNVGGDFIELSVLLPVGTDPHSFDPTPQDIARVADADVVFANGAGLETFLDHLIESAGAQDRVVYLSDGVSMIETQTGHESEQESAGDENGDGHHHEGVDPHTWTSPLNVVVWCQNVEKVLSQLDPSNAEAYGTNAITYTQELEDLDLWIRKQVGQIPEGNRKIVTDHAIFGYFTETYGFQQLGALIPAFSTLAQPSAQDLAQIEDAIHETQTQAIFVGKSVNPTLADRVASDTGARLYFIYTGSLSDPGGEAGTYLDYMRYNTLAFVGGLK